jgi:hypothetical protein
VREACCAGRAQVMEALPRPRPAEGAGRGPLGGPRGPARLGGAPGPAPARRAAPGGAAAARVARMAVQRRAAAAGASAARQARAPGQGARVEGTGGGRRRPAAGPWRPRAPAGGGGARTPWGGVRGAPHAGRPSAGCARRRAGWVWGGAPPRGEPGAPPGGRQGSIRGWGDIGRRATRAHAGSQRSGARAAPPLRAARGGRAAARA